MKTFLPLVFISAILHAESLFADTQPPAAPAPAAPAPAVETHAESAESAESGAPAGGAGERSEPEGVSHAESAEAEPHAESAETAESGSPAGGAGERSEPEGVSHAEPAEPAAPGGGVVAGNDATGGNDRQLELVDNSPPSSERGVARSAGGSASCGSKHCAKRRSPLRAEVSLIDGSILKGTLRQHALPARSRNLGEIRVRLDKVESIAFGKPGAPAKIAFRNGDTLTARFPADRAFVTLDTLVGRVRVPFDKVASLAIASETTHSSLVTRHSSLLYYCTFDSASSIAHPAAGPAGKFLRGEFVPGKAGNALRVEADTPAFESMLPKGFLGPEGTIEFWAKIEGDDPRYVDGGDPLFVSLYDERGAITLLQFAANNGFARGGLGGAFVSWPFGTIPHYSWSMEYRKVLGEDWAGWHHYAMSWKAGGFGDGSFAKVFVDGKPQPVLGGVDDDKLPARLADYANHAHELGIPWSSARAADRRRSKKPFLVDDLRIWSVAKTDFACPRSDSPIRHSAFSSRHPELLYHCTFDDAQSVERPAAGPAGKFLGGEFVPGKKGHSLRIPGNVPTALVDLPRGMMQPRGTIEFWSKIEDPPASYGDRGNPRFFGLSLFDDPANPGPCSTYLQFTSNDGMGMSGLCGMIYHRAMATDPHMRTNTYGPILEDPVAWHHYAIVWDSDGLSFSKASDGTPAVAAIVLDGHVLQTFGRNQFAHGKGLLRLPELQGKLAFPVADTGWGFFPRPVAFLIDEFKIWSVPKTDFGIDARPVRHYKPELLYHCTFDSAEAVEKSAAGPAGKFLGGEFVPGKFGNALRSPGDVPVAEVDLPKGFLQPRGTIEFWTKIEEPPAFFGDRGNPLFFGTWLFENPDEPGPCSTHLGWCANNGMGMAGLCGMVYHRAMATDPHMRTHTYRPLLDDPAAWHHYAILWDSEGLPFSKASDGTPAVATLVLDGKVLQTFGRNQLSKGEGLLKLPSFQGKLAFPVPAARWSAPANHVPFLIDEFKIWSAPVVPTE